ncbi:MAG: hypothetical protein WBG50_16065 [Desulfomonilaceae bacterium]
MADKDRKGRKSKLRVVTDSSVPWWPDPKGIDAWPDPDSPSELVAEDEFFEPSISDQSLGAMVPGLGERLEQIKESHSLLKQFTSKELKTLLNLKRNTSPKAWSLREDLVVLTLPASNREIAELLSDRNKEAVKKRLQLLRSKGLVKRLPEPQMP